MGKCIYFEDGFCNCYNEMCILVDYEECLEVCDYDDEASETGLTSHVQGGFDL